MSELGSSAAVGIESVEWLDAGGGQLTVRVTGRWRRRRGWVESRGPTMLVIEAEGRRHRFPATPEPPSLSGAAPGTWRLSFGVPAEIAHGLGGHVWLALGTVTVPLPVPESAAGLGREPEAGERPPGAGPPGERPAPERAAAEPPAAEGPAAEGPAAERPGSEAEMDEPPATPERPPEKPEPPVAGSERDPGRLEIERAWRRADAAERTAGELGDRVSALERALEHERAERAHPAARPEPIAAGGAERQRLRAEDALRAARRRSDVRVPTEPIPPPPVPPPSVPPPGPPPAGPPPAGPPTSGAPAAGPGEGRPGDEETISALRRELRARVSAEAALHARIVQAETRLAARVLLEQRTTAALAELRAEFERLHEALEHERTRRRTAEASAARLRAELGGQRARSRDAHAAIEELRSAIELLRPPASDPPPAPDRSPPRAGEAAWPPAGGEPGSPPADGEPGSPPADGEAVTPDRLSDALTRLRQTTEPREAGAQAPLPATLPEPIMSASPPAPLPVPVGGPTVEEPFRRLAARDLERAGRLLIGLLGAQRAAWPHAVAYDLVLGPGYGCVLVSAGERGVSIERSAAPRSREQVVFQLVGGPARLARLFSAGPLRRLLRIGVARVRGRREGVSALRALLALPLDLGALRAAGAALDGETLFTLLAAMIDPAWTRGERFTISHTDERGHAVFLQIRDGEPPLVSPEPPGGRVATALAGPAERLWWTFTEEGSEPGAGAAGVLVTGDQGPLTLVREWANRAQSGHGAH
jgi:hypothetical protein